LREFIVFEEGVGFRIDEYYSSYPRGDRIIIQLTPGLEDQERIAIIKNTPANVKILMSINEYQKI
jgi:hypothetical protein